MAGTGRRLCINPSPHPPGMSFVSINWLKISPSRVKGKLFDAYWSVSPVPSSLGFLPWFNIEASETEVGPWIPLLPESVRADYAVGMGHQVFRASAPPYARLAISPSATAPAVQWSPPYFPGHNFKEGDFLLYREILRKEILALEAGSGYPSYLLQRIRGGFPCPNCSDEILGGGTASPVDASGDCGLCFGTGIYGGYHTPQLILTDWPERTSGTGTQTKSAVGRAEDQKFSPVHVYAYPAIATDDIIVDAGAGTRFIVISVEPILWKVHTVGQDLTMGLLPQGHPAYKIPISGSLTSPFEN